MTQPLTGHRSYGLVGQGGLGDEIDPAQLRAQYDAGVRVRLIELGWNVLQPTGPEAWDVRVARAFQDRIDAFTRLGPDVQLVLDLGLHYPPDWVMRIDPLVDQFGHSWQGRGGANVYWSAEVRRHVAAYISQLFAEFDFHDRLWIVRVGVSGGELLYPSLWTEDQGLSFWAFDRTAQEESPVAGWKPGQDSPHGEAATFYTWYVDNLVVTFNFVLTEVRHYYEGYVAPVTPGLGMNEFSVAEIISRNLSDPTQSAYGTGNYWQRIFALLPGADAGVMNWCSSLGDGSGNDASPNWWEWSSARQQAYLAAKNGRDIFGENAGANPYEAADDIDPRTTARQIFAAVTNYNYRGLLWVSQAMMEDPRYLSLDQYGSLIATSR
ncbi:MAG TPA: hypothetical protein VM536_00465 [Chloroflexia bacterium]|nr:hypothetical protein [Chloroflexia bacterium]